jgi:CubicO group peptidase (beta-lactamase class C family)
MTGPVPALRRALAAAALLAVAACSGAEVSSPTPTPGPSSVEDLARSFRAQHEAAGLVVGVVEPGGDRVIPLGVASRQDDTPVDGAPLREAILLSHEVHHRAGGGLELGLGWHVDTSIGGGLLWHNGATAGFRSFLAFEPEAGVGVVILCNEAVVLEDFNDFAFRVARASLARTGD